MRYPIVVIATMLLSPFALGAETTLDGVVVPLKENEVRFEDLTRNRARIEANVDVGMGDDSKARESTILRFDPKEFNVPNDGPNRSRELQEALNKSVEPSTGSSSDPVPIAPEEAHLLGHTRSLSLEQLETFLERKQEYLEGLRRAFAKYRVPAPMARRTIQKVNDELYRNAEVIAAADRSGPVIDILVWGGLGLNERLVNWLSRRLGRQMQNFIFSSVTSLNVVRWKEDDQQRTVFEVTQNNLRSHTVHTGAVGVGVGILVGYSWGRSDVAGAGDGAKGEASSARVLGPVTTRSTDSSFTVSVSVVGQSVPLLIPFLGDLFAYSARGRLHSLFVVDREKLKARVGSGILASMKAGIRQMRASTGRALVGSAASHPKITCRGLFSP